MQLSERIMLYNVMLLHASNIILAIVFKTIYISTVHTYNNLLHQRNNLMNGIKRYKTTMYANM